MEKNKYDRVNLLRIAAFLMVFLLHCKMFMPVAWQENFKYAWTLYTPEWAGVWIFLFVAGYGIGAGFYSGKYELTWKGLLKFYYMRLIRLIPIYWLFIGIVVLFFKPDYLLLSRSSFSKWCSLLFFNYQEEFDNLLFGCGWYFTTLFRLYLIAPLFFYLRNRYLKNKKIFVPLFLFLVIGGLALRIAMGYHISLTGEEWNIAIYKPYYFNLDLFFCGFMLNELRGYKKDRESFIIFPWLLFLGLVLYNCYIYFRADFVEGYNKDIYCYLLPTVYLLICAFIIYNYDTCVNYKREKLSWKALKKNIFRIIDYFAKILLPLYLFHSIVLMQLKNGYVECWYLHAVELLHLQEYQNFAIGCIFSLLAFLISLIVALIVHNMYYVRAYQLLYKLFEKISNSYKNCARLLFAQKKRRKNGKINTK